MAKVCEVCGKRPQIGKKRKKLRGKYNPTTKVRRLPNLQKIKLPEQLAKKFNLPPNKKVSICSKCLKRLFKG